MRNNRKQKRVLFVSLVLTVSVIALGFIISNFRDNIVFFYSPSELEAAHITHKAIRVGGLVVEGSVKKIDASTTIFTITDLKEELVIHYQGLLPDLFREGQGIVAKGKLDAEKNEFFSKDLLVKHDEKYMPPEVARSLEKNK